MSLGHFSKDNNNYFLFILSVFSLMMPILKLPKHVALIHNSLLTYLLTLWSRVLLEKLSGLPLVKKFPSFYGTRRFITAFTSARHLSLSGASSIQSIPPTSHFLKIHLNIILPSAPGSPQWTLSLRFPHQNPVHASPLLHTRYIPRPSHCSWFYHSHNIGWAVQIIKFLIISSTPLLPQPS